MLKFRFFIAMSTTKIIHVRLLLFHLNKSWKSISKVYSLCFTVPKYSLVHNLILQPQPFYNSRITLHSPSAFHGLSFISVFFLQTVFFSGLRPIRLFICHSLSACQDQSEHANHGMPERNENIVRRSDDSRDNDDRTPRFFTLSLVPKDGMPDTVNYRHEQREWKYYFFQDASKKNHFMRYAHWCHTY